MAKACIYCGNNPVNHFSAWMNSTLGILFRARHADSRWQKYAARLAHAVFRGTLFILEFSGVAKTHDNEEAALSARGRVLWEEAKRRGITMRGFSLFGKSTDAYRARVRGRTIVFSGLPRPRVSESGSQDWLDDKWLLKERLRSAGIPVPRGGVCTSFPDAERIFRMLEKPVVVKPREGSRGRHTTTHVTTDDELRVAFARAKQLCRWVIVEEHLSGGVYRGTAIDGGLSGVLAGFPPRVVGDGIHTIEELTAAKNASKHPKISDVIIGPQHHEFLARTGRTVASRPAEGETVDLLEKIGVSYGGTSAEVTDDTHPATKEILTRAARIVADPVIGFDFIIPDITRSPDGQKWGIIECNSTPFINLHHDPVEGKPVNVAASLWEYVEKNIDEF